ncbi:Mediator complex subunit 24 [Aphelenchoides fujianensis]|nr:Mediator complex subunit 24 [Aphelenchoides fujianensis]
MDDVKSSSATEATSPSAGPSSSSSASSDDFLAEPLGALRRVIFNAFATREDPVDFIAKFNSLQNSGLVPVELRPEITVQALIDVGCATNECHPLLFAYLDALLECQHFDFIFYVLALTSYRDLRKPECVASFAEKIACLLRVVDCDFRDDHALHNFCDTYVTALQWFLSLLWEIADQRLEQAVFLAKPLVDHVHFFARDHTAKTLREDERSSPTFRWNSLETYRFGSSQPRPAILTLVSIFAYFRVGMKNEEMADAIANMGEIMLMSRTQVISDLFRGSFLGLLEGNAALPLERQPLGEVFMYKRVVRIAEIMVETGLCSVEELHQALIKLVSNSALLNALDQRQMENTFATVFEGSKISEFLSEDQYTNLTTIRVNNITKHEKRMKDDKDYVSPFPNGCVMDNACHPRSRFRLFLRADRTAAKIIGNTGPIDPLAVELVDCADVELVDLILGCLCAENNKIKSFSGFLSTLTNKLEQSDGSDTSTRVQLFDSAFLLLSRIRQIFCDLRLDEMTDNVTTSTFYKWTEKYKEHFDKGQLLPVNEEIKQSTFMSHFARLKLGQAFWNEGWNFEHLLAHAPAIGEALLDEIRAHEGSKVDEEAISNILSTFGGVTSMFLCLCQWLETNPLSDPVQQLAQGLRDYDAHPADGDPILLRQQKRWKFTIQLVTPTLNRIIHGPRARENVYTWLVNCARRELPVLDPTELPHMKKLKHAFYFAMQQGWASPDVVMYLDRMNKNIKHEHAG